MLPVTEVHLLQVLTAANRISVRGAVEKTIAALHQFAAGASPVDDVTLLALRIECFSGKKQERS